MKRIALFGLLSLGIVGVFSATKARAGDDDVAAILLSATFPGAGEWYRAGFSGGFPLVECILGTICPCVGMASIFDAAAGKTDDAVRFDFWSAIN